MAEEKKSKSAGEEGGGGGNVFVDAIFWFLIILVAFSIIKGLLSAFNISFGWIPSPTDIFAAIFNTVQLFSIFMSLLFLVGIIYFNFLLGQLMHHGHGHEHGHGSHDKGHDHYGDHSVLNNNVGNEKISHANHEPDSRWQNIQNKLMGNNSADWRMAIIESDIILDDMMKRMGYHGDNLGEMLKQVEKSDFETIDLAWEAHKVRNRIAHDGDSFKLSHEEAKRVVGLYEKVFKEFYFI